VSTNWRIAPISRHSGLKSAPIRADGNYMMGQGPIQLPLGTRLLLALGVAFALAAFAFAAGTAFA
jgi:hypothetical protein